MFVRLSKNSIVRQLGPYTYILERIDSFDVVFKDADVFFRWITRTPIDKDELVARVCSSYEDEDCDVIKEDFEELLAALLKAHIVVAASTIDGLDLADRDFSYDSESPKTMNIRELDYNPSSRVPTKILDQYYKDNPSIFGMQIEITEACTERCLHCYFEDYKPVYLPLVEFEKVIKEFRRQGGVQVGITGGECMLHPDFERFVRCVYDNDLIPAILSNLTLCSDRIVRLIKETGGIVQTSLYSMNEATHDTITRRQGSFKETTGAIERLRKANVPCLISCPTMKQNFRDYLGVLGYARSLKMDAQTDFIVMGKRDCDLSNLGCRLSLDETRCVIEDIVYRALPVNSEYFSVAKKDLLPTAEEWAASNVCGAGVNSISMGANGDFHPCPGLSGVVLGNCYQHSLNWVLHDSPEMKKLRAIRGRDFQKCVRCEDRDYCSVCMCRNYNETGNLFEPAKHFCDVARINHEIVDAAQDQKKYV